MQRAHLPDLDFRITGVASAARSVTPLLHFTVAVTTTPAEARVQSVMLQAQIQIQAPQRAYNPREQAKLEDLFGTPERWGQTLRNRLFAHAHATVPAFTGRAEVVLPVVCTYDLNVASAKYFYALEEGDVPLLFLFSGTVFHQAPGGPLQVQPISWDRECAYRMPVALWREMMDAHYGGTAWITLERDVLDRLYAFRRRHGLPSWEQAVARLLEATEDDPAEVRP